MNLNRRTFIFLAASGALVGCTPSPRWRNLPQQPDLLRLHMTQTIVNYEARRDSEGKIIVYRLPRVDGGGRFEVAGINEKYHRAEAYRLRRIIRSGDPDRAEREAVSYIASKTDFPASLAETNAIRFLLRDIAWNRGPTGAVRTLQIALGQRVDGKAGELTRAALARAEQTPRTLIRAIRAARETYERSDFVANGTRDETSILWAGLVNRWNKASRDALRYL